MNLVIATVVLFLLAMLGLGVGVMLTGRCLQGSCGGEAVIGPDGKPLSCTGCPRRRRPSGASTPTREAAETDDR
jgi:hypothetical protein